MKLAIICTGGGMRCAYSGGALVALAKELHITTPNIAIGISGGAGSLAYYLSEQYADIKRIWTELLATNLFISFRFKKPILDIDYLIDTVFKRQAPLDVEKLKSSTADWFFPATDIHTQKRLQFFSKKDSLDIFEILRASMAVPFIYGKEVLLGKFNYQDGDFGLTVEDSVTRAQALGATHIIIIESQSENFRVRLIDRFFKNKLVTHKPSQSIKKDSGPLHIVHIRNTHSPAGLLTRNRSRLQAAFDKGYADTMHNPDIRLLLSEFHPKN